MEKFIYGTELITLGLVIAALVDTILIKCNYDTTFTFFSTKTGPNVQSYRTLVSNDEPIQHLQNILIPAWNIIFASTLFLAVALSSTFFKREQSTRPSFITIVTFAIALGATLCTLAVSRATSYLELTIINPIEPPLCTLGQDIYFLWSALAVIIFSLRLNYFPVEARPKKTINAFIPFKNNIM